MTILQETKRIDFDPSITEHRHAVVAFMKRTAWNDSPLRFNYDPDYGSVADQVRIKMLDWYIEQDTGFKPAPHKNLPVFERRKEDV